MTPRVVVPLAVFVVVSGCYLDHGRSVEEGTDAARPDAGPSDAGGAETGTQDAEPPDASAIDASELDAGEFDAAVPDAGPIRPLRWVELATEGERPPPRMFHFAVYDDVRDRMIVFGGSDPYEDTGRCCVERPREHRGVWSLDLSTERWTLEAELESPLLAVPQVDAVIDRPRGRVIIFAVSGRGHSRGFAIDLATWSLRPLPPGPWPAEDSPRLVAHDAERDQLLVHDSRTARGMWALDLVSDRWSTLESRGSPELRFHTVLTPGERGTFYLYAGMAPPDMPLDDLWRFDRGRGWSEVLLVAPPLGRIWHGVIYEPARRTLVVFGGSRDGLHMGTLLIDPATGLTDEPALDPAPGGRRLFTLILDARRRRALAFGGALRAERVYDDTWALELP